MNRARPLLVVLLLGIAFAAACTIYTGDGPHAHPPDACDPGVTDAPIDGSGFLPDAAIIDGGGFLPDAPTDAGWFPPDGPPPPDAPPSLDGGGGGCSLDAGSPLDAGPCCPHPPDGGFPLDAAAPFDGGSY